MTLIIRSTFKDKTILAVDRQVNDFDGYPYIHKNGDLVERKKSLNLSSINGIVGISGFMRSKDFDYIDFLRTRFESEKPKSLELASELIMANTRIISCSVFNRESSILLISGHSEFGIIEHRTLVKRKKTNLYTSESMKVLKWQCSPNIRAIRKNLKLQTQEAELEVYYDNIDFNFNYAPLLVYDEISQSDARRAPIHVFYEILYQAHQQLFPETKLSDLHDHQISAVYKQVFKDISLYQFADSSNLRSDERGAFRTIGETCDISIV